MTKSRVAIASENQLYRTQLNGYTTGVNLTREQQLRLHTRKIESESRQEAAKLETGQIQQQLFQAHAQLASAQELLTINQNILNQFQPLTKQGAISKLQYLKQQQDVSTKRAEVVRLTQEQQRLQLAIAQSNEKLRNTTALSQEDFLAKITVNDKSLAEIDSQLSKVILENQKRIYEINSQSGEIDSNMMSGKLPIIKQQLQATNENWLNHERSSRNCF